MKTIKYLMTVVLLGGSIALCSCTQDSQAMPKLDSSRTYSNFSYSDEEVEETGEEKVYICTGPSSKRYHKSSDCMGLSSCSADIRCVTIGYAEELGRTPCKRCY